MSESSVFKRMLIAVDGRAGGHEAVRLGNVIAGCCPGVEMTLAYVHVPSHRRPGARRSTTSMAATAEAMLAAARDWAQFDTGLTWTSAESPAAGLTELAADHDADIIILGSSHRGPASQVLLGHSSRDALALSQAAVAIAPRGYRRHTAPDVIGIGCDGSPGAAVAYELACGLRGPAHASLTCAAVVPLQTIPYGEPIEPNLDAAVADMFSDEQLRANREGELETYVGWGEAGPVLVEFSRMVDLLVLGFSDRNRTRRPFSGSTAAYLGSRAHCPLLVTAPVSSRHTPVTGSLQTDQPQRTEKI